MSNYNQALGYLNASDRDRWILERRGPRNRLDPRLPYAFFNETEPNLGGGEIPIGTVLLTNRECPYRCLMCDLWQNTLEGTVPDGAIAAQIRYALERLEPARQLKLYNAGSFFDPAAIPPAEYAEIAALAAPFERVIVECHPAVIGRRTWRFRDLLTESGRTGPRLEIAMGLETVHPVVLDRLNKRMTLEQFRKSARQLKQEGVALRVFLLVRPPWMTEAEGVEWAKRSLEFAFECGAETCSLIPTRAGNGAMEALQADGEFSPPTLHSVEAALEFGLSLGAGRVLADLWDLEQFATCAECAEGRAQRLRFMNARQEIIDPVTCRSCS